MRKSKELKLESLRDELSGKVSDDVLAEYDTLEELEALSDVDVQWLVENHCFDPLQAQRLLGLGLGCEEIECWLEVVDGDSELIVPWASTGFSLEAADWFRQTIGDKPKLAVRRYAAGERPPEGWAVGDDPEDYEGDDEPEDIGLDDEYPPDRVFP